MNVLAHPASPTIPRDPTTETPDGNIELAEDLARLEIAERAERDRKREAELARLRELARYD